MKCPLCNAPTDVKQTFKQDGDYIRRRMCFNGHTFKTKEILINHPKPKRNYRDRT